jgi:hypothetical protein
VFLYHSSKTSYFSVLYLVVFFLIVAALLGTKQLNYRKHGLEEVAATNFFDRSWVAGYGTTYLLMDLR